MIAGRRRLRRGISLVEILIVVAIVAVVVMIVLMVIPRSREAARLASCTRNLGVMIGPAMAQYDGAFGHLPPIAEPGSGTPAPGPLATLAEQFGLPYFEGDAKTQIAAPVTPRPVRGFVCPADTDFGRTERFPAVVSYRGNTGSGTDGAGGPFGFDRSHSIADAEAGAGSDYTAAFAERLIGSGAETSSPRNDYQVVPGPVAEDACPDNLADAWKTDAGSSWAVADWRSTLYNHAMKPNEQPSCIAKDSKTARMGASSAHANRVNVLMLGGSVRGYTLTVDRQIWRTTGAISRR